MTREDEIEQRLKDGKPFHSAVARDDIRYLLARVRQLEGRLPPVSVDVAAVRERMQQSYPVPWDHDREDVSAMYKDLAALCDEIEHWRAVTAMLLSDNPDERVQAAVWETRRQTAQECCEIVEQSLVAHGDQYGSFGAPSNDAKELASIIKVRFGLEEQR